MAKIPSVLEVLCPSHAHGKVLPQAHFCTPASSAASSWWLQRLLGVTLVMLCPRRGILPAADTLAGSTLAPSTAQAAAVEGAGHL